MHIVKKIYIYIIDQQITYKIQTLKVSDKKNLKILVLHT